MQPVTLPFSCDTSHCAYGLDCFTGLLRCCLNVTTCRPLQASLALGVSNSLLTKKNNSIIGFSKATMCLMFETPSVLPKKRTPPKTETLLYYHVFLEVSRSEMLRVWTDWLVSLLLGKACTLLQLTPQPLIVLAGAPGTDISYVICHVLIIITHASGAELSCSQNHESTTWLG